MICEVKDEEELARRRADTKALSGKKPPKFQKLKEGWCIWNDKGKGRGGRIGAGDVDSDPIM